MASFSSIEDVWKHVLETPCTIGDGMVQTGCRRDSLVRSLLRCGAAAAARASADDKLFMSRLWDSSEVKASIVERADGADAFGIQMKQVRLSLLQPQSCYVRIAELLRA